MKSLLASSFLVAFAAAQDPASDVAVALLRRDGAAAAARAAATAESPALRARLQAALSQVASERAAAMLAVARAFPADPEADRALVAGAAAAVVARGDAASELVVWDSVVDDRTFDGGEIAPVVLGLRDMVAARRAAGGDAAMLQEADRQLSLACVSRFGLAPVRVPLAAAWQRPKHLAEPLQLRLLPCGPGELSWSDLDTLGAPAWSATLPVDGAFDLPPLAAGDWLLEARSTTSPWRGVRRVLVSDLEAIALTQDGHIVVAAFDARGPVAAKWELVQGGEATEHGELGAAPALVRLGAKAREHGGISELRLRGEAGAAWLDTWVDLDGESRHLDRWQAHTMVDRPVYRPGETVTGRVVLRACQWAGEGCAQVPTLASAPDRDALLVVRFGRGDERTFPLRTDANGVAAFTFVVPAEAEPGSDLRFEVEMPELDPWGRPLRLRVGDLCGVANYRRQAMRLRIEGPEQAAADLASADVVVHAEWASGGPAAGVDVQAVVETWGDRSRAETVALRTDVEGRATVRIPIASLAARGIDVAFMVTGPDGRAARGRHRIDLAQPGKPAEPREREKRWYERGPSIDFGDAVVGAPCHITLRGEPREHVVLVVGRGSNARVRAVRLGDDGALAFDEPVLRLDWPRFDVTAATRAGCSEGTAPVRLRSVRAALEVPERSAPGSDVTVRATTDSPGALVTFAVVDERIYELVRDLTPEPDAALRPWAPWSSWHDFETRGTSTPGELLASLLDHGRLPSVDHSRDLSERFGRPSGGRAGPPGQGGAVRSRFCPNAHFTTVVADAQGSAATTFKLPDDLTRWRVTAVVIGADSAGTIVRKTFASRQPLAVEPVLPRALRAGDTLSLPLAIDRAADAAATNDDVAVSAAAVGDALAVERAETRVAAPAGRVSSTTVPLRAVHAGEATLQLATTLGEHADRSERVLAIAPDRVARPLAAAASGTGEVTVVLPDGASLDAGMVVDVMQGGAEAWRLLEQDLAQYPYGCAEQTLARLVSYFALVRAAKVRHEAMPAMDDAFGQRLRAGLARLQTLQGSSGTFAFWPGEEPDSGITGLVLHGLAILRDGGFDLAKSGLDLSASRFYEALPQIDGVTVVDAPFVAAAEVRVGQLRVFPKEAFLRRMLQPAVDVLPKLPAGLCARLGLALHAAGDVAGARACRERLRDATPPALAPDGFPGEDPLAVLALRLELDVALQVTEAERERAAAELLLASLRGGGSTYGRSCALAALALVLPRTEPVPGTVVVEAGGERRELAIGGQARAAVRCVLPRAAKVVVRGPAGMALLVRVRGERAERASDHTAWATPIRIERGWCTVRADATWEEQRDGRDLAPFVGPLLVGRPLVLRLVVQSPVPMRRVVVDCPLPAGFEVRETRESRGVQRFDDRVALACDLAANVPTTLRIDVVPTIAGRFVWPPAVAAPMYASDFEGGTAGAFVEVAAVPPGSVPSVVTCMTGPWPAVPQKTPNLFEPKCRAIAHAIHDYHESDGYPDEAARQRAVEAGIAELARIEAEPWSALESLTSLARDVHEREQMQSWLFPELSWRLGALARLRAALAERTVAAFALPWPEEKEKAQRAVQYLQQALVEWPADAAREPWVVRWWQRARSQGGWFDWLFALVPDAPKDADLIAVLREIAIAPKRDPARQAWALLSDESRRSLPPALVLDALGADHDGVIAWLAGTDAGRAELRRRLHAPQFVRQYFDTLHLALPAPWWTEVPLAAYEQLATVVVNRRNGAASADDLIARLAQAPFATGELQRALAAAKVPAWRFVLASALRARGAGAGEAGAIAADDAALPVWLDALALGRGDVASALALLEAQRERQKGTDLAGDTEMLARFVAPILVAAASPAQLYAARTWFDDARWRAAWARLASAERVALLSHFQKHIGDHFVPDTAAEADALWQFVQRSDDLDGPLASLLASPAGVDCVRRHLTAGDAGKHAAKMREQLAKKLALDADTLEPSGGELRAVLTRVRQLGLGGAWTATERGLWQRARLLRGV